MDRQAVEKVKPYITETIKRAVGFMRLEEHTPKNIRIWGLQTMWLLRNIIRRMVLRI